MAENNDGGREEEEGEEGEDEFLGEDAILSGNYYRALGVPEGASHNEIKRAYRKQQLTHHPDKGGNEELCKRLNEAYRVLSDQLLRRDYDVSRDEDDDDDGGGGGGGEAAPIPITCGFKLSDKYKEKIHKWRHEFSQFILEDNFFQFFGKITEDVLKEHEEEGRKGKVGGGGDTGHRFWCQVCDKMFQNFDHHYNSVLSPYVSYYLGDGDDEPPGDEITDAVKAKGNLEKLMVTIFGEECSSYEPAHVPSDLGIWGDEGWGKHEELETLVASYLKGVKMMGQMNESSIELSSVPEITRIKPKEMDPTVKSVSLDQLNFNAKDIEQNADRVRVNIGQIETEIRYSIKNIQLTKVFHRKEKCCSVCHHNFSLFEKLQSKHHFCKACGHVQCSNCQVIRPNPCIGISNSNVNAVNICRPCHIKRSLENAKLWAVGSLKRAQKYEENVAATYLRLSYLLLNDANLDADTDDDDRAEIFKIWEQIQKLAEDRAFYSLALQSCECLGSADNLFSFVERFVKIGEYEWAYTALKDIKKTKSGNAIWLKRAIAFAKHSPALAICCLKKEKLTTENWIEMAEITFDEKQHAIAKACLLNLSESATNAAEIWPYVCAELIQAGYYQLANWAFEIHKVNFATVLKKLDAYKTKGEGIVFLLNKMENQLDDNLLNFNPIFLYTYWAMKSRPINGILNRLKNLLERSKSNQLNVTDALVAALFLKCHWGFKQWAQLGTEFAETNDITMTIAFNKLASLFGEKDNFFQLGVELYPKDKILGHLLILVGSCELGKVGDYFFSKGNHKLAIDYYWRCRQREEVLEEKAAILLTSKDKNSPLYYSLLARHYVSTGNIKLLISLLLTTVKDENVLRQLFAEIFRSNQTLFVDTSTIKIHEHFITSSQMDKDNVKLLMKLMIAAQHYVIPAGESFMIQAHSRVSKALKLSLEKSLYSQDFDTFTFCLVSFTPRNIDTAETILKAQLGYPSFENCSSEVFKGMMLLLRGTIRKVKYNDVVGALQFFHDAINLSPALKTSTEIAKCLGILFSTDVTFHEDIFSKILVEVTCLHDVLEKRGRVDTSKYHFVGCSIIPEKIGRFSSYMQPNPSNTALRKGEAAIDKRLGDNPLQAAFSYIDLSMAACGSGSSGIVGSFVMAISYLVRAVLNETDMSLKYAYTNTIFELALTIYYLGRKLETPYLEAYLYKFVLSATIMAYQELAKCLKTQAKKKVGFERQLIPMRQQNLLTEVLKMIVYLGKICPLTGTKVHSALDTIYIDISGIQFLQEFFPHKSNADKHSHSKNLPKHLYSYHEFEGVWRGWISTSNISFDFARAQAMEDLLQDKGWDVSNVQDVMNWSIIPRNVDGWSKLPKVGVVAEAKYTKDKAPPPLPLIFESEAFCTFYGFQINFETGSINLLLKEKPIPKKSSGFMKKWQNLFGQDQEAEEEDVEELFSMQDVSEIFQNGISFSLFSLEEPDSLMRSHPFQEAKYIPQRIAGTNFLKSLIRADVLLKELTTGVETNAKPPFAFRSSEHLLSRLPPELAQLLRPLPDRHAELDDIQDDIAHRFWMETKSVIYSTKFNKDNNVLTYRFGDVDIAVKKHLLRRDENGVWVDDELDTDDTEEAKFARDMTKHYDEIGKYFPELKRLKELAKISMACRILKGQHKNLQEQIHELKTETSNRYRNDVTAVLQKWKRSIDGKYPQCDETKIDTLLNKSLASQGLTRYQVANLSDCREQFKRQLREADSELIQTIISKLQSTFGAEKVMVKDHVERWILGNSRSRQIIEAASAEGFLKLKIEKLRKVSIGIENTGLKLDSDDEEEEDELGNDGNCNWVPAGFANKMLNGQRKYKIYGGVCICPQLVEGTTIPVVTSIRQLKNPGRSGKAQRKKELMNDDKLSSAWRGWLKQEANRIKRGQTKYARNPPGIVMAHRRGFEAHKGFSYKFSDF